MDLKYYKRYCKYIENVENYEKALADNFKGWDCHHRFETHNSDGERRLVDITTDELIALEMYYDRPASELIFMKHSEHSSLHTKGRTTSEEVKKKQSEAHKGKHLSEEAKNKVSEFRKGKHLSEETKKKISETEKGKLVSEETRNKISDALKGKPGKPLSEETRNKISKNGIGRHWYNNSQINKFCYECPEGFVPGRL